MSESREEHPLRSKLDQIQSDLMGNPSEDELRGLQLQLDVLAKWDRMIRPQMMSHDHDHMDDHDHTPS